MTKRKQYLLSALAIAMLLLSSRAASAQERKVENKPYIDLRPFHFGVIVGTHFQDLELNNIGPIMLTDQDGHKYQSVVSVDQDRWDLGFHIGVLGEARLGTHLAFRLAPVLYFGTRHLQFLNYSKPAENGLPTEARQTLKSVYIGSVADIIFSAKRLNNHRPYIVAGLTPVLNLTSRDNDYIRLKKSDIFASVGIGCDFYLPFFKFRPELKFMYGLSNSLDKGHVSRIKDVNKLPYASAADKTRSKLFCLSFYFE